MNLFTLSKYDDTVSYFMICDKEDYEKYQKCIDENFYQALKNMEKFSTETLFEQKHEDKIYTFG
uniref:Ankyrin repeat-containing protein n=1 Tax=Borely moumouvirus TaxID=2712067 RepID=A0A6G6ADZ5_9VIRU